MYKKVCLPLLILSLIIIFSAISLAGEISCGGEISQGITYSLDNNDIISIPTNLKLELEKDLGLDGKLYLSLKGNYDFEKNEGQIKLDEAYGSIYLDNTDLTIGQQIINWGTADGFNPTNVINPTGSNYITGGELCGLPVVAGQATYYDYSYDLTGVIIPRFVPREIPVFSSADLDPATAQMMEMINQALITAYNGVDKRISMETDDLEYAVKLGTWLGSYDLRISYFNGREDLPALISTVEIDPVTLQVDQTTQSFSASYRRTSMTGLATAGTIGSVGVWGELAYFQPEKLDLTPSKPTEIVSALSINEPYIQTVIGGDYTFNNGIYAEAQYLYNGNGSLLMPYNLDPSQEIETGQYLMNRFSYEIDQDNQLELNSFTNLNDGSMLVMPVYTHGFGQLTDLKIGPILIAGNEGEFSNIPQQLSISLKTCF